MLQSHFPLPTDRPSVMYFCLKKSVISCFTYGAHTDEYLQPRQQSIALFFKIFTSNRAEWINKRKSFLLPLFSVSTQKPKTIKIPCNKVFSLPFCRFVDQINRKTLQITCINNDSQFTWTVERQRVATTTEKYTCRSDRFLLDVLFVIFFSFLPLVFIRKTCCQFACYLKNGFVLYFVWLLL